jgi:NMD protein affecting ribosome stability and mRNA decay
MATYRHYCDRCGEEADGDSIRCDRCGLQMCGSCATRSEFETEVCAACRGKQAKLERLDELRTHRPRVLACMRKWYDRNVIGSAK